jgi:hypothetical protein
VHPTHGETEASAKGVRSSTARAILHGEVLWNATPATPEGPLGRPSFFIENGYMKPSDYYFIRPYIIGINKETKHTWSHVW